VIVSIDGLQWSGDQLSQNVFIAHGIAIKPMLEIFGQCCAGIESSFS